MAVALGLQCAPAHAAGPALPTGGQFVGGAGAIAAAGANGLAISQSTARGIIDWRSFNIGAGGAVSINNGAGVTLNRVTGGQLSSIEGALSATGSVYLVNPQGVVVGPGGRVLSGGSVVLSSRDIGNDAFMAGTGVTAAGTSVGDVTNKGTVLARTGDVVIIGHSVANTGLIQAANGAVTLAAGNTVVLAPVGGASGVVVAADASATGDVTEAGRIEAAAAALTAAGGNVYSLAGSNAGLVQATGTAVIGGHVWLTAPNGTVSVAGTVTARNADGSGGQIIASGKTVNLASTAKLDASGTRGGDVLVGVTAPQTNLADSTTISGGAQILAGGSNGGGHIETSGHTLSLGAAGIDTGKGGSWLIDPYDLTIDTAGALALVTSLNAGSNITEQTSAGSAGPDGTPNAAGNGDILMTAPVNWAGSGTLTLNALRDVVVSQAISNTGTGGLTLTAGRNISITAGVNLSGATGAALTATTTAGAITVGATVSARLVSMTATGGNLAISSGSITGRAGSTTGAVTLNTTANFVNSAGAGAVVASGSGSNWRIYSTDPGLDTPGGLAANFYQYNAPIGAAANGAATGNGLLYSLAPSVTYGLTGSVTKPYDGTNSVTGFTSANISAPGLVNSDTIAASGAALYSQTFSVGTSLLVSIPGVTITHGGKAVYGYSLSGNLVGVIGAVTPAAASVNVIVSPSKTYDSSSTGVIPSSSYSVTGVNGEVITVGQASSVTYDSPEAGTNLGMTISFANTSFVAGSGVSLSNYTLPTTLHITTGIITQAPVKILGISAQDKTYDGTSLAPLNTTGIHLFGLVNAGDVTLDPSTFNGTFMLSGNPTANVGSGLTVSSNIAFMHTGKWQDYTLVAPAMTASIVKLGINLQGLTGAQNKTYDATTTATVIGTPTLVGSGLLAGDAAKVSLNTATAAANFATANAGTNISVILSNYLLAAGGGGDASGNYNLILPTFTADINKAQLSMALAIGFTASKVYDGSANGTVDATSFVLNGWAGSEGGHLSQTTHVVYSSPNALGANASTVTTNIALTDVVTTGGASMQNYLLPAPLVFSGTVTPAPITIGIIGNPTKVFDGNATATLASGNYDLEGFVSGQSATVTQTAGTYVGSSGNAGSWTVSANITGFLTAGGGTLLTNYSFPSVATGAGTITRAPVGMNVNTSVSGSKVYDGNVNLFTTNPSAYTFSFTGLTAGDQSAITLLPTAILGGAYGSANAGVQTLTLNLDTPANDFGGINVGNYIFQSTATGIGTITKAPITLGLTGTITKVYNGSTDVFLSPANVTATGFVAGQGIAVNQLESAAYDSALASGTPGGATLVTGTVQLSDLTANGGTLLSNYSFQNLSFTHAATITKAPVTISGLSANSKVYDQNNVTTLTSGATIFGVIAADLANVTLSYNTAGATFSQVNVGTGLTVTPNGSIVLTGTASQNYSLTVPSLTASITKRSLTVSGITIPDLVYNNTTAGTISGTAALNGVLGGDSVTLVTPPATATFAQKDVGNNIAVTVGGYSLAAGGQSGNYSLSQPGGFTANITPRPLTVTLQGNLDKIYDGTAIGYLTLANFNVTNFAAGEGSDVNISQAYSTLYDSSHATVSPGGATTLTATLVVPDYHSPTTDLSNYTLQTTVSHAATITPAPLTAQIIGNPTKTYDSLTTATVGPANLTLLGFVNSSQGATITAAPGVLADYYTSSGGSPTANAGVITIKTSALPLNLATFSLLGSTVLTDYTLPTIAIGGGTINPRTLTASLAAQSKVYDGSTLASGLTTGSYIITGLQGGQTLTVGRTSGVYNSKDHDAATTVTVASLVSGDFTGGSGFSTSNYIMPTSAAGTGAITPLALTVGGVTKIYDATFFADPAHGASYSLTQGGATGVVSGDTVTINGTGVTGNYTSATDNVGTGLAATLSGLALSNNPHGDYSITSSQSGNFGTITQRQLSATLTAQTKTYDTTTNTVTALTPAMFLLTGFAGLENAQVNNITAGHYNSKDVNATSVTSNAISSGDYADVGGHGFLASNYILPTSATGPGTITPATLHITLTSATKVYDSTNTLQTATTTYTISGVQGADVVNVANATGTFDSVHVGAGIGINVSAITLGGGQASDYVPDIPAAHDPIGTITPAQLTLKITGAITKPYDGTTATNGTGAQLTAANFAVLSGLQANDGVTVNSTAEITQNTVFNSQNVLGAGLSGLTLSGLTLADVAFSGVAQAGDYTIAGTATGTGTITPVSLTGVLSAQSKTYDGNTNTVTALTTGMYTLTGLVHGETATVGRTSGTYTDKNVGFAGNQVTVSGLTGTDFTAGAGSLGTTFIATNYTIAPTIAGPGTIGAKTISLLSVTKVYDSSHDLTGAVYLLNGVVGLDTVSVIAGSVFGTGSGDATTGFSTQNVGSSIPMTLSGIGLTGAQSGNYSIPSTSTASIGVITPHSLTVTLSPQTKVYDGLLALTGILSGSYTVSGLAGSEQASVTQGNGTYNNINVVGATTVTAALAAGNYADVGGSGFLASNYTIQTTVSNSSSTITKALLGGTLGTQTKVYDGLTVTTAGLVYNFTGLVNGEKAQVNRTTADYDTQNVGAATITVGLGTAGNALLTAGNFSANGVGTGGTTFNVNNYTLPTSFAGAGTITKATLGGTLGAQTKVYDGLTVTTGSLVYNFTGLVHGETVQVDRTTADYDTSDVGAAHITVGLGTGGNALLTSTDFSAPGVGTLGTTFLIGNYNLPASFVGTGTITPLVLTAHFDPVTKIYDNTGAITGLTNYQLSGFIGTANTALLSGATTNGTYTAIGGVFNVGPTYTVTSNGTLSGTYSLASGASGIAADYALPSNATGTGTVTPRTLTATFAATTRAYDTTNVTATLTGFVLGNFVGGNSGTLTSAPATTTYPGADVQSGTALSVGLGGSSFTTTGTMANYQLPATATGTGSITPFQLTAVFDPITKVFDNTTNATGLTNFLASGFFGAGASTGAITTAVTTGTYQGGVHVGSGYSVNSGSLTGSTFALASGTVGTLADYALPSFATGVGAITPLQLTASFTITKIYDSTGAATGLSGFVAGGFVGTANTGAITTSVTTGTYQGATFHVGTGYTVLTGSLTGSTFALASGASGILADYSLPSIATGTGAITPKTLTASFSPTTKVYDGSTTTSILTGFVLGNFVGLDAGVLTSAPTTTTYGNANVQTGTALTAALGGSGFTLSVGSPSDYALPSFATGTGDITKRTLTATFSPTSKTYDGSTTTAALTGFTLGNFVGLDAGVITSAPSTTTYANADVQTGTALTASLGGSGFSLTTGLAGNYQLPSVATGTGSIIARILTASFSPTTKVYDGSTTTSTLTGFVLGNFVGLDAGVLTSAPGTTTYGNANVQIGTALTAALGGSGFTLSVGNPLDYALPSFATGTGDITKRTLTATFAPTSKTYDGSTTTATLSGFVLGNFVGLDAGALTTTPATTTYGNANVQTGTALSASLGGFNFTNSVGLASNYQLPSVATGTGDIVARVLTASFSPTSKTYDGSTTTAALTGFVLGNFVGLDTGVLTSAPGTTTYGNADVQTGTALLAGLGGSGFSLTTGAASNYALPANATGTGSIIARILTASFSPTTKVYDGTSTTATLTGFVLGNFVGLDAGVLTSAPTTTTYGNPNVQTGAALLAGLGGSGFTLSVGNPLDYALAANATGTGSITKAPLTASFSPTTKVYDGGTTTATLTGYALSGFVLAESGTISGAPATAVYGVPDVTVGAQALSTSLLSATFTPGSGTLFSNYTLPTIASGTGTITPLQLTASFADTTKVYDQTLITSPLTGYVLAGFIGAQNGTISNAPVTGLYNVKDVTPSPQALTVSLTGATFNLTGGANAVDYAMPTAATGLGTITQAPLHVSGLSVFNKVYDGTTAATLNIGGATGLTGVFAGDLVTLNVGPNSAQFVSPNVGNAVVVNLSGGSITGHDSGDYFLVQIGALAANITPKTLTLTLADQTKVYDGNTTAGGLTPGSYTLSGLVGSQTATVGRTTGAYNSPNVFDATSVTVGSLTAGDYSGAGGFLASNYSLPTTVTGRGVITPAPLTAVIIGTPTKVFDGTDPAVLTPANFQLTGFIGGEGAGVNQTVGTYANPAVGPEGVTALLGGGNFAPTGGTLLSNYRLPASASGLGLITAAPVTVAPVTTPTRPVLPTATNTQDTITGALRSIGQTLTPQLMGQIRQAAFTVADVRTYIPYPAPGALSSWRNNGWGTLPIVIDDTTDYSRSQDDDGNQVVQSGAPVINSTEQVMESGVKNKRWRITIPRFATGPTLFAVGPIVAANP